MLPTRVVGGLRPPMEVTWLRESGEPEPLTGAVLSGTITDRRDGTERPIEGALSVTDGAAGTFMWDYAPADVATAGMFEVRFTASFGSAPSPAKTFAATWKVVK